MTRGVAVLTVVGEPSYRRAARASVRALLARTDLDVVVGTDDPDALQLPAHPRIAVQPITVAAVHGRPDPFLAKFRTVAQHLGSGAPRPDVVLMLDVDAVVVAPLTARELAGLLGGRDFAMAEQPGITGSAMSRTDFLEHYVTHALPAIDPDAAPPSLADFRYYNSGVVVARPEPLRELATFALDRYADRDRAHVRGAHMVADQDYVQFWCTTLRPGTCSDLSTDWNHCRWWDADYPRPAARIRHLSNFTQGPVEETLAELEALSVDEGITAVVITHESGSVLPDCLQALAAAGIAQVVVVDNASTDASVTIAGSAGCRVVAEPVNVGFASAVNRALLLVGTEQVALVNPDLLIDRATLDAAQALLGHGERVIAVPDFVSSSGTVTPGVQSGYSRLKLLLDLADGRGWGPRVEWARRLPGHHSRSWQWPLGACVVMRTTDLDALGGLDPGYFVYMEDVDLGLRWSRSGGVVRSTGTTVVHESSTGAAVSSERRRALLDAARLHFAQSHYGRAVGALARWAAGGERR
jgi:N-acetylglucosaminyl-diphospho-decaprenol L-rhamnosyltransferase